MSVGITLNEQQAMDIYMHKITTTKTTSAQLSDHNSFKVKGQSAPIAKRYGVSPKTIRDIWNRRTWAYATIHLWYLEQPDLGEVFESGPSSCKVFL